MTIFPTLNPFASILGKVGGALLGGGPDPQPPTVGAQPAPRPQPSGAVDLPRAREAIKGIESGGKYDIVGPRHPKLGRALGAYQVMEANVGPWTKAALGREVDPETFLRSPDIQDAVFDHVYGGYAKRFGPEGAAQAWFAGPGGVGKNRRDSLGTGTQDYGRKFMAAYGRGSQPRGSQPGMVPASQRYPGIPDGPKGQETIPFQTPGATMTSGAPDPSSRRLPTDEETRPGGPGRGPRIDISSASEETGPGTQNPSLRAFEDWKVNRTTRRLRGLNRGATIGAIAMVGADLRAQMESENPDAGDQA